MKHTTSDSRPNPLLSLQLMIVRDPEYDLGEEPVRFSSIQSETDTEMTRAAERMVISCRENARFLGRHLARHADYLDLPPDLDNVLYLAYTISIKMPDRIRPDILRQWLHERGIETETRFTFVIPERMPAGTETRFGGSSQPEDGASFCLPCHHLLTIPDLIRIVEAFDAFFEQHRRMEQKGYSTVTYRNDNRQK